MSKRLNWRTSDEMLYGKTSDISAFHVPWFAKIWYYNGREHAVVIILTFPSSSNLNPVKICSLSFKHKVQDLTKSVHSRYWIPLSPNINFPKLSDLVGTNHVFYSSYLLKCDAKCQAKENDISPLFKNQYYLLDTTIGYFQYSNYHRSICTCILLSFFYNQNHGHISHLLPRSCCNCSPYP